MSGKLPSRRDFIVSAARAGAGVFAALNPVMASRVLGANDRIHVGIIGCGGRGSALRRIVEGLAEQCNVAVIALCDVWKPALEMNSAATEEAFGRAPETFTRYGNLLALKEVDAVMIATPDFAHAPILRDAAEAGKHAYCEKPMASRIEDANAALEAVESNGIVCQVGTQRRSCPRHQKAAEIVQSAILGVISEV